MRRSLAVCGLMLVLGAGCGGDGGGGEPLAKEDYEAQVAAVLDELAAPSCGPSGREVNVGAVFDCTADAFALAADALDGIAPPEEIASPHEELVGGASETADQLREWADEGFPIEVTRILFSRYAEGSLSAEANWALVPEVAAQLGVARVVQALDQIQAQGYELPELEI